MIDVDNPVITFNALDRCDRCGAQAYTLAAREDMPADLLFCLNHRRRYADNLEDEGWTIIDDYEGISRLADGKKAGV